ncbi:hypothetical protein [Paenibacillus glycanilyticus]|uniref:Zinc ribbon domain-containing protein n=1 Tax=Paenibacillus glycanilyticus TaxID=126569 RepID=A0ABQ6G764_9BACL|nr:hypothetical protein [Paenibacillus glycanilyticus]GLX66823.1 hypothetical protein MU1_11670 [Paenibacillus glycanilyticus]
MNQDSFILIQIVVPMALVFLLVYKYIDVRTKTTHFVCPACRSRFKLSKKEFAFARKTGVINERVATCPVCNYKGSMPFMKD